MNKTAGKIFFVNSAAPQLLAIPVPKGRKNYQDCKRLIYWNLINLEAMKNKIK
jgi:hypothetical protein